MKMLVSLHFIKSLTIHFYLEILNNNNININRAHLSIANTIAKISLNLFLSYIEL